MTSDEARARLYRLADDLTRTILTVSTRQSPEPYADGFALRLLLAEHAALRHRVAQAEAEAQKWRRIRTPTHGSCCTCQACGQGHDECRCDLDEVADELTRIRERVADLEREAISREDRELVWRDYSAAIGACSTVELAEQARAEARRLLKLDGEG